MAQKKKEFSPWDAMQMLNISGNQTVPADFMQMSSQASEPPPELGGMSMPPEPPPPPQLVTPAQQKPKLTAQPTMQALGELPQEMEPTQKTIMSREETVSRQPSEYGSSILQALGAGEKTLSDSMFLQQQQVDKLKNGLAKFQGEERRIDFRPIASQFDTWFGGSLAKQAEGMAPMSPEKRAELMAEMQKAIVAGQGNITASQQDALKNKLAQLGYEEQRKTQLEIARLQSAGGKNAMLQQREDARLDRETQALEKRIGDIVPGIVTKFENLNKLIPGGIDGAEGADVPGVGPGMFMVPDVFLGQDASDIQQNARSLVADYIKLRSGTAASDKEVDRTMKEFGMSGSSKVSTFRSGLQRLKQQTIKELRNKQAGFRPEVVNQYKERGGITEAAVEQIGKGGTTPPPPAGGLSPEKQKRLEELKLKLGK